MAEALDTYSDLDMSDSDGEGDSNLNARFKLAADHVSNLVSNLDSSKLLRIYSLYKQATEGPCNTSRPRWYDMQAKQKWDAWNSLGDMSPDAAKEMYVATITELDPGWDVNSSKGVKKRGQNWVTVSCLNNGEDEVNDKDKTVFDFCRDRDVWQVRTILKTRPDLLNTLDNEGLGLIHWAADRGYEDVLKMLIGLNCDISLTDDSGQTALHYAVSCEHFNCVKLLLQNGIDKSIKDNDGKTAADLTHNDNILSLLN